MSLYDTGLGDLQSLIEQRRQMPPDFLSMAGPAAQDTAGPYLTEQTDPLYSAGIMPMQEYAYHPTVGMEPDLPVPQPEMPRRAPMWERLGLALGSNPFRVDMDMASGGNQGMKLLLGLLAGYANTKVNGSLEEVKRREKASQSVLARQQDMATRNRQARQDAATERGRIMTAMSQRFRAPKPKFEVLGPDIARVLGRPELAGKSMPKDEYDALVGQAKDVKTLREKPGKAAGWDPTDDPAMTRGEKLRAEVNRENLTRRIAQMQAANARDQAAFDALPEQDRAAVEKGYVTSGQALRLSNAIAKRTADLETAQAELDAANSVLERFGGGGGGTPAGEPPSPSPSPTTPPAAAAGAADPAQGVALGLRQRGMSAREVEAYLNQTAVIVGLKRAGVKPEDVLRYFNGSAPGAPTTPASELGGMMQSAHGQPSRGRTR